MTCVRQPKQQTAIASDMSLVYVCKRKDSQQLLHRKLLLPKCKQTVTTKTNSCQNFLTVVEPVHSGNNFSAITS